MKTTFPYNLKKGFIILGLVALPFAFSGCEKENVEPNRGNRNSGNTENPDTPDIPKHNVELTYGKSPSTQWQNIDLDTISKYNNDPAVDTIFMIPEAYNQFSGLSTSALQTRVTKLRERHNINPNKVLGKGDLQLASDAVENNQEIVRFFADTLKYNVLYTGVKSR